jgi:hypothetical protein
MAPLGTLYGMLYEVDLKWPVLTKLKKKIVRTVAVKSF